MKPYTLYYFTISTTKPMVRNYNSTSVKKVQNSKGTEENFLTQQETGKLQMEVIKN